MPVDTTPQAPSTGVVPDVGGKPAGPATSKPPGLKLRPMTSRQKIILVLLLLTVLIYVLAFIDVHLLH